MYKSVRNFKMENNAYMMRGKTLYQFIGSGLASLKVMHHYQPMMSNLIALTLLALIAMLTNIPWLFPALAARHHYVMMALGLLAGLHIIRAARKSLLLPSACALLAGLGILNQHCGFLPLPVAVQTLQSLLLLGMVGLCVAIFHIP